LYVVVDAGFASAAATSASSCSTRASSAAVSEFCARTGPDAQSITSATPASATPANSDFVLRMMVVIVSSPPGIPLKIILDNSPGIWRLPLAKGRITAINRPRSNANAQSRVQNIHNRARAYVCVRDTIWRGR